MCEVITPTALVPEAKKLPALEQPPTSAQKVSEAANTDGGLAAPTNLKPARSIEEMAASFAAALKKPDACGKAPLGTNPYLAYALPSRVSLEWAVDFQPSWALHCRVSIR